MLFLSRTPLKCFTIQGLICSTPLAYILPALCYMRLEPGGVFAAKKLPALFVAAFGISVFVIGVLRIAYEVILA